MPPKTVSCQQRDELTAQLNWIEKAYTVVGTFWAGWAIAALVGIYTHANVKLPVLGEVTFTEVLVYTLYAFTIGVPFLIALVFRHRKLQKVIKRKRLLPVPRFSKLPEAGIPACFRTLGFLALVVLPIVTQEIANCWLYGEISIAWKPAKWWQAKDYKAILSKDDLFTFPSRPELDRGYANWRFMRFDPKDGVRDKKKRERIADDDDGRPTDLKGYEPVQISAAPGFVPWAFRIAAHGCAVAAGWLLVTREGSLPQELFSRLQAYPRSRRKRRSRRSPKAK